MAKKFKFLFVVMLALTLGLLGLLLWYGQNSAVLNPHGMIGEKERSLLVIATWLMLIVVIPVFVLSLIIAWKYRANNPKAKYTPEWDRSHLIEAIWWGIPCIIVAILSVMTWQSCHELDPFRPIDNGKKPIRIQVVALQWKWLFIYPEQGIATVNFIQFPEKTPLNFEISADAPMNSFWIPRLGGQMYAMPGMNAKLYLIADQPGVFQGSSANISGEGFSGMRFLAKASSEAEFETWVQSVKNSSQTLTMEGYEQLVLPSKNVPATYYVLGQDDLYHKIIMKYMEH